MTAQEAALYTDIQRHEQQVYKLFPEATSYEKFEETRKSNPARIEALRQEKLRSDAAKQQLQALTTNRQAAQQQIASLQREQEFQAHDNSFNAWLAASHPNFSKGAPRAQLTEAVKDYLRTDLGLTDQEIKMHYSQTGLLRSASAQKAICNGALWKMSQARAREVASKRALPPVGQRPGVYRPAGSAALEDVAALTKALENAHGERDALRIATKLSRARRAAGI